MSQADGRYSVAAAVTAGTVNIRVTRIGYRPATRSVSAAGMTRVTADFVMESRPMDLDAVVVTGGAGPVQVRSVGHSVAQIRVADLPEPVVSVDHLLNGKVPGLMILPSTGLAGSGARIRLRGSSSVALSNQPLVYVDGIRIRSDGYPKNLPLIGERTRGQNDNASPLNDINPADIDRVEIVRGPAAATLYGTEAAAGVIQIFTRRGAPGRTVWNSQFDAGVSRVSPFGTSDERYMRLGPWLRSANKFGTAISASGGSDVRYLISASYLNAEGVLPNDHEKRVTVRGNFDLEPVEKLSLRWNSAFTINDLSNTPSGPNGQGITQNAYRGPANATGVDTKESLDRILAWDLTNKVNHALGGITAVFTQSASTTHTVTLGYDRAEMEMRSLRPFGFLFTPQGILSNERWISTTSTLDYLGNTRFRVTPSLTASLAWGGQSIGTQISSVAGYAEGFAGPAPPTLSSGAITLSGESRIKGTVAGAFTQATFGYRDILFLTGGLRIDGSSSFGEDFGLQPFPRASLSYVASDAGYWPARFPTMRMRVAYGQAGKSPRALDQDRTWLQVGFNGTPAYVPGSVGNAGIGPERSSEIEAGFDASARNDRWTAGFTAYRRTTTEALLPVAKPPSLGFTSPQLENVGTMRISGVEMSLSGQLLATRRLSFNAGVDVSLNKTKTIDLGDTAPFVLMDVAWIREGLPTPVIVGLRLRNPEELAEPDTEQGHVYGPNMPTKIIGMHSSLRFRGIELAGRVEYQGGSYIYDEASRALFSQGVHPLCNRAKPLLAAGKRNETTAWERLYCVPTSVPISGSIVSGDFAKLRDLSLTVPLPGAALRTPHASLVLAARNYLVWRNSQLKVWDPEMGGRDGMFSPVRTIEFAVPPPGSLSISVRASYR
jgi:outer membrane receptor protein involved in Fe transport